MFFASDNSGPVPQAVLDALAEANTGHTMAYGADRVTAEVTQRIRLVETIRWPLSVAKRALLAVTRSK